MKGNEPEGELAAEIDTNAFRESDKQGVTSPVDEQRPTIAKIGYVVEKKKKKKKKKNNDEGQELVLMEENRWKRLKQKKSGKIETAQTISYVAAPMEMQDQVLTGSGEAHMQRKEENDVDVKPATGVAVEHKNVKGNKEVKKKRASRVSNDAGQKERVSAPAPNAGTVDGGKSECMKQLPLKKLKTKKAQTNAASSEGREDQVFTDSRRGQKQSRERTVGNVEHVKTEENHEEQKATVAKKASTASNDKALKQNVATSGHANGKTKEKKPVVTKKQASTASSDTALTPRVVVRRHATAESEEQKPIVLTKKASNDTTQEQKGAPRRHPTMESEKKKLPPKSPKIKKTHPIASDVTANKVHSDPSVTDSSNKHLEKNKGSDHDVESGIGAAVENKEETENKEATENKEEPRSAPKKKSPKVPNDTAPKKMVPGPIARAGTFKREKSIKWSDERKQRKNPDRIVDARKFYVVEGTEEDEGLELTLIDKKRRVIPWRKYMTQKRSYEKTKVDPEVITKSQDKKQGPTEVKSSNSSKDEENPIEKNHKKDKSVKNENQDTIVSEKLESCIERDNLPHSKSSKNMESPNNPGMSCGGVESPVKSVGAQTSSTGNSMVRRVKVLHKAPGIEVVEYTRLTREIQKKLVRRIKEQGLRKVGSPTDAGDTLITATVFKTSSKSIAGIILKPSKTRAIVSKVIPGSLFSKTPIAVGDEIISVNNVANDGKTTKEISSIIQQTVGAVTVLAKRSFGNDAIISKSIDKGSRAPVSNESIKDKGSGEVPVTKDTNEDPKESSSFLVSMSEEKGFYHTAVHVPWKLVGSVEDDDTHGDGSETYSILSTMSEDTLESKVAEEKSLWTFGDWNILSGTVNVVEDTFFDSTIGELLDQTEIENCLSVNE